MDLQLKVSNQNLIRGILVQLKASVSPGNAWYLLRKLKKHPRSLIIQRRWKTLGQIIIVAS